MAAAVLVAASAVPSAAQRSRAGEAYIEKYAQDAVNEMFRSGVPASITLAQGMLESANGQSYLALKGNNHFGIKCHDWKGPGVYMDAEKRNECFRKYRNVSESYRDHSDFLRYRDRYKFLFDLKITDYKGWAHGLKKAGYATDPSYANRLISIIEDYELYKYDREGMSKRETRKWERLIEKKPWLVNPHQVYIANGLAYVVARAGDTFQLLGGEFDISWKKLVSYNDLHKEYTLEEGDVIYLKKKNKKAQKPYDYYIVRSGDSMHSISQKFGIRLKNLYKMNKKDADYVPEVGHKLKLR